MSTGEIVYHEFSFDGNTVADKEYLRNTLGSSSEIDNSSELVKVDVSDRSKLSE